MRPLNMKSLWIAGAFTVFAANGFAQTGAAVAPDSTPAASPAALALPAATVEASSRVPFAEAGPDISDTANAVQLAMDGHHALAWGLPQLATEFFQEALLKPNLDPASKDSLNLGLVTAFLAQGQLSKAADSLKAVVDTSTPAYVLRSAMLLARNQNWAEAGMQSIRLIPDQLSADDQPWYFALEAMLAEQRKDLPATIKAWTQAGESGTTQFQKTQFEISLSRAQILLGKDPTPEDLERMRTLAETTTNNPDLASEFAHDEVVMLYKHGDRAKALEYAKNWIGKTSLDVVHRDNLRLEFVTIDNEDPKRPSTDHDRDLLELKNILNDQLDAGARGHDELVELQKKALSLLASSLAGGSALTTDVRDLQQFVDGLVNRGHPLLKQLRLFQAQLTLSMSQDAILQGQPALSLNLDADAAKMAKAVLEDSPKDPGRDVVREDAWRIRAFVASRAHPPQYRNAADSLHALLDELPVEDPERKNLTVTMADMYFLNGDYPVAGDAYANLLHDPSPPTPPGIGVLLMRAVESELNAGQLDNALARLDDAAAKRADIDNDYTTYRWQAVFNVLSALSEKGPDGEKEAFSRLTRMLDPAHGADLLPVALHLRLRWLDAYLTVRIEDASAAGKARDLLGEIEKLPPDVAGVTQAFRDKLMASALLLCMQAAASAKDADAEKKFYDELQQKFPGSDEAVSAMFIKAREAYAHGQTAEAQGIMVVLLTKFPNSSYASDASYDEADYAAKRGTPDQYIEAIARFRDFTKSYPEDPRVYKALLQVGDLYVKLNQWANALEVYNNLLNNHSREPSDPEAAKAAMARVGCLIALADNPTKRNDAMEELERLYNLETLPMEARIEAGWKWGGLKENIPDLDGAAKTYFVVVEKFLNDPYRDVLPQNSQAQTWLSKCLFNLAKIYERQNKNDEARSALEKVIRNNLPYSELAKSMLENSGSAAPPPPVPNTPSSSPSPSSAPVPSTPAGSAVVPPAK